MRESTHVVAEPELAEDPRNGSDAHEAKLVRRHLLLDPDALDRLCALYNTSDASEAVRMAIDLVLLADDADRLSEVLADARLEDLYTPPPPLPETRL
jgi:hypothetical protein